MELWPVPYQEFKSFFLILIRVSVILLMFPFFNSRVIPVLSKTGLALIMTIILFPVVGHRAAAFPESSLGLFALMAAEFIIGMTLGLLIQIFFEGVRMMGQLVGFQTGFAITNILDPQSGVQISIFSNTAYLVAMVLFLGSLGIDVLTAWRARQELALWRKAADADYALCWQCGYRLQGHAQEGRCPECGWKYEDLEKVRELWHAWRPTRGPRWVAGFRSLIARLTR